MSEFWDWAVAAYGREGVAEACLKLQDDHDQNVPLLLWAAWASLHTVRIDEALAVRAADVARVWADEVIVPLRGVRRRLKSALHDGDEDGRLGLREQVKTVELKAEKALMQQLSALIQAGPLLSVESQVAAIGDGLTKVFIAWSGDRDPEVLSDLHQALTKG